VGLRLAKLDAAGVSGPQLSAVPAVLEMHGCALSSLLDVVDVALIGLLVELFHMPKLVLLDVVPFVMDFLKAFRPVLPCFLGLLGGLSDFLLIQSDLAAVLQVLLLAAGDGILEYPHLTEVSVVLDPEGDRHRTGEVPPHGARACQAERVKVLI
jgi:hypothetical protein